MIMTTLKTALSVLVLFASLFGACHSRLIYRSQELTALIAIQRAWNNTARASFLTGWSSTEVDPCSLNGAWEGVICLLTRAGNSSDFNSVVVGLILSPNIGTNIVVDTDVGIGTLPPEIGNLTNIVVLSLPSNRLSGPIPKELGSLTNLETLNLGQNNFNGSLPEELANLLRLQELDLSENSLTGQLPNIGGMKSLRKLTVSGNQLLGPLPSMNITTRIDIGNLTNLLSMDLSRNNFTGSPPHLTSMISLRYLNLSNNRFNGSVKPASNLVQLDLSHNEFTGPLLDLSLCSKTLTYLSLGFNRFDSLDWKLMENLGSLIKIDLSSLGLSGEFPYETMKWLAGTLVLDQNHISGDLNISRITKFSKLSQVSIMDNNIATVHYASPDIIHVQHEKSYIMLQGNPYCNFILLEDDGTRCFCNQTCLLLDGPSSSNNWRVIIISVCVSSTLLGIVILMFVLLFWRGRRGAKRCLLLQVEQRCAEFDVKPTIFTYSELRIATRDFHPDTKLGQGSYGVVFKGTLSNGMDVAVKQLFFKNQQGIDEFLNEVVLITGVKHRNLVKLKGFCLNESKRLLVYEYAENFDLAKTIFESKGDNILTWPIRLNICLGVARGLHYLHEIAQPRIIHRDIKAHNVMLDKNMQAKIADFGLALLFPDNETHITTNHIAGTLGYLAPEYASRGQLTEKVDVFSFGVVVLEVVSGRMNIVPNLPPNNIYLIEQAWRLHNEGNLLDLVDPNLHLNSDEVVAVKQVINVALLCLLPDGEKRPSMARVVTCLQGEVEVEVIESILTAAKFDNSYEKFLASTGSGFNFATVTESSSLIIGQ